MKNPLTLAGIEPATFRFVDLSQQSDLTSGWPMEESAFPCRRGKIFFSCPKILTDTRAFPVPYFKQRGPFSLGLKRPGCEAAYLHATSAYVKNKCSSPYIHLPHTPLWRAQGLHLCFEGRTTAFNLRL